MSGKKQLGKRIVKFSCFKLVEIVVLILLLWGAWWIGGYMIDMGDACSIGKMRNTQADVYYQEGLNHGRIYSCDEYSEVFWGGALRIFAGTVGMGLGLGSLWLAGLLVYKWIKWNWWIAR